MARRLYQRFPADLPAQLLVGDDDATALNVHLKDISRGGAFVATRHDGAPGSALLLVVHDAGLAELRLPAQVVHRVSPEQAELWSITAGLGLRFVELGLARLEQLDAWLAGLAARLDRVLDEAPCDVALLRQIEAANRQGDLCGLLGVAPLAARALLEQALEQRGAALSELLQRPDLSGELRRRLIAGRFALQRAGDVLCDDAQRARYLQRIGALGASGAA